MIGSVTQRAPARRGATSINPAGTGFPEQLWARHCWDQGSSSCCSPACQGLTPTRSLRCVLTSWKHWSNHNFLCCFLAPVYFFFSTFLHFQPISLLPVLQRGNWYNSSSMEQTGISLKYRLLLYFLLPVLPTLKLKKKNIMSNNSTKKKKSDAE